MARTTKRIFLCFYSWELLTGRGWRMLHCILASHWSHQTLNIVWKREFGMYSCPSVWLCKSQTTARTVPHSRFLILFVTSTAPSWSIDNTITATSFSLHRLPTGRCSLSTFFHHGLTRRLLCQSAQPRYYLQHPAVCCCTISLKRIQSPGMFYRSKKKILYSEEILRDWRE